MSMHDPILSLPQSPDGDGGDILASPTPLLSPSILPVFLGHNIKTPQASRFAIDRDFDFISSPARRGRLFANGVGVGLGSIDATADGEGDGPSHSTPKPTYSSSVYSDASGVGAYVGMGSASGSILGSGSGSGYGAGISQSSQAHANPFSSPGFTSPLDMHAGADAALDPSAFGTYDIQEDTYDVGTPTPTHATIYHGQSPMASRPLKRGLEGIGASPMRSAKRSRYATLGSMSIPSLPASPLRPRMRQTSGASVASNQSGYLLSHQPLGRAVSMAGAGLPHPGPFLPQDRNVSTASMMSTASTELLSPHLGPQAYPYLSHGAYGLGGNMDPYPPPSQTLSLTIAPSALNGPMPLAPHTSALYQSPEFMDNPVYVPSTHPSASAPTTYTAVASPALQPPQSPLSHGHGHGHGHSQSQTHLDRGMTLSTIHEGEQDHHLVTPATEHHPDFTPGLTYSAGMPSQASFASHPSSYPGVPGMGYGSHSHYGPAALSTPATGGFWVHRPQGEQQTSYVPPNYSMPSGSGAHPGSASASASASTYAMPRATSYSYDPSYIAQPYGARESVPMPRSVSASYVPTQGSYTSFSAASTAMYAPPHPGSTSAPMSSSTSLPTLPEGYEGYELDAPWAHSPRVVMPGEYIGGGFSAPSTSASTSVISPTTPSKRKYYPPVGKRLKPGPKPKNTPKKLGARRRGDEVSGETVRSVASSQFTDSSLGTSPGPSRPRLVLGSARAPSPGHGIMTAPTPGPSVTSGAGPLTAVNAGVAVKHEFGGPLSRVPARAPLPTTGPAAPFVFGSGASAAFTVGSIPSGTAVGANVGANVEANPVADAATSGTRTLPALGQYTGPILVPQRGNEDEQPMLVLNPPAVPGANQASVLPREFIERMYIIVDDPEAKSKSAAKRYRCLIEGCERIFPRKSAINSHIQTHLDDKPYRCEEEDCQAAFVRQHDLRRHMRIHTGTKPFPCSCGKGFARGDALMRHRQRNICVGGLPPLPTIPTAMVAQQQYLAPYQPHGIAAPALSLQQQQQQQHQVQVQVQNMLPHPHQVQMQHAHAPPQMTGLGLGVPMQQHY